MSSSSCSVPAPRRARSADPHEAQTVGARSGVPAVMAAKETPSVQHEGDVAIAAAGGAPARATVDRGSKAAAVEEQDRPPPAIGDQPELGEQRGRERVAALPPEVDDPDRRERLCDSGAEIESLEEGPALRSRGRAPEEGDGALEQGPPGGDRPRVVARIRLLLVRRVVLLVDADDTERRERCEDGRASTDHDPRLASLDPISLVAALGLREPGVQAGHLVSEAGPEAGRAPAA